MYNLTIVIPTYNRKDRLTVVLSGLFKEKNQKFNIIILDNCSDYSIEKDILEKENFDKKRIKIIKRQQNIGMIGNVTSCLVASESKWMWLLSDDDEVMEDAIKKIYNEIESNDGIAAFKFSTEGIGVMGEEQNIVINSLEEFIDYYYGDGNISPSGNLVFMSNNVFNMELLKEYIKYAFDYSYTQVPHMIPIIIGLNEKKIKIKFSEKKIVKYISPELGKSWSVKKIGLGASTFSHLPLSLNKEYFKKFLKIIMWIDYRWSYKSLLLDSKEKREYYYKLMYVNIYKYYLKPAKKIKYYMYLISLKFRKI